MRNIYLDNATTTRPTDRAISKMLPFFTDLWGAAIAPHQKGQELYPAIEESLKSIYALLGASEEDHFVFTSSGPEAVNHVILSAYTDITLAKGKNQFITSTIDEAPMIMAIGRLEQMGCVGKMIDVNENGTISEEMLEEALSPRTALVSLSWANGLTGVVNPVSHLCQLCRDRGVSVHLDATHVLGKVFYEMEDIGADFITFNGDHLHAPKGTGGLYIKQGVSCSPFILGGLEQAGKRAGHLNVPALVGMGVACEEQLETRDLLCTEVARLRDKLEKGITEGFSDAYIFYRDQDRLPNVTTIAFPGISNEAMLYALNRRGVFASIGGGSYQQLSLVLQASGIPAALAETAISFSLSRETHEDDIERAATIIVEAAEQLAKTSEQLM